MYNKFILILIGILITDFISAFNHWIEDNYLNYDSTIFSSSAKANTLLNFLNLNNRHVKFVADKSKSKQNKFLPGSRIPIISPDKIAYYKPDIIIIFPWNIADEIKSSLKEYELYVLLPKLKKIK